MNQHSQPGPAVVIVDDHPAVREALAQLLEENGFLVAARAKGRGEAMSAAADRPDVMLVDLSLGEDDAYALMADCRKLGVPVVACSASENENDVKRALASGARAYVAKREAAQVLVRTIRDVLSGWVVISPRAAAEFSDIP